MADRYLQKNGVWGNLANNGTYLVRTGSGISNVAYQQFTKSSTKKLCVRTGTGRNDVIWRDTKNDYLKWGDFNFSTLYNSYIKPSWDKVSGSNLSRNLVDLTGRPSESYIYGRIDGNGYASISMIDDSNGATNRLSKNNGFTFEPLATNGARFYINKSVSTGAWGNSSGSSPSYFYFYFMEIPSSSSPFATYVSNNLNKKFKEFRLYLDNSLIIRFTNPNGLTIFGNNYSSSSTTRLGISGSFDMKRGNGDKVSDILNVGGYLNGRYYYIALFKEMNGANE